MSSTVKDLVVGSGHRVRGPRRHVLKGVPGRVAVVRRRQQGEGDVIELRRATDVDAPAVADVFLASFKSTYPSFRVVHSDDDVRGWIAASVIPQTE